MDTSQVLWVASDHAGLELKRHFLARFMHLKWEDLGPTNSVSVDYPDYAKKLAQAMSLAGPLARGVLICGSGQGMAISANRFRHIRAALCWNEEIVRLARQHNDANVLCLGGRVTPFPLAEKILTIFLETPFEGGRHQIRVQKMS